MRRKMLSLAALVPLALCSSEWIRQEVPPTQEKISGIFGESFLGHDVINTAGIMIHGIEGPDVLFYYSMDFDHTGTTLHRGLSTFRAPVDSNEDVVLGKFSCQPEIADPTLTGLGIIDYRVVAKLKDANSWGELAGMSSVRRVRKHIELRYSVVE